jgi:hypothetical protein
MTVQLNPGTCVRMTDAYKVALRASGHWGHIAEFGHCIGYVVGPTFPNGEGPEVDVRWLPSMLRYGYHPSELAELPEL